jgi:dihydrodipicolinate synthase/N-acetylneuraminate lyase
MELGDTLAVIAGGQKENHMNMWPYGCDGYLSTFITFKPEVARRYWHAIEANRIDQASEVIRTIDQPFFRHIASYTGGFDAAMHGILEIFGLAGRWRRPPYYTLSDEEMERLREFLA